VTDPLAIRPAPGTAREFHFPHADRQVLANGIRVVSARMPRLPLVSVAIVIDGAGGAADAPGREGLASLTASMLIEGAGPLDSTQIAERLEDLGTTASSTADWDCTSITATLQPAHLDGAVEVIRDLVRRPSFPPRECDRLRAEHHADRMQLVAEPRSLADAGLTWRWYEPGSRYRRSIGGTAASVAQLSRDDVARFWTARYAPSATTVILAGDIDARRAGEIATRLSEDWEATVPAATSPAAGPREGAAVHLIGKPGAAQCELRVGHVSVPRSHADYFPLTVMNAILGGLFSSRVNLNLRERHGYTYGAHSGFDWRRDPSPWYISAAVNTEHAGRAIEEVRAEIDRIRTDLVAPDELSLATSYLAGVFPLRFETTSAVASALAMQQTFALGDSYFDSYRDAIAAVTFEDVRRVARRHLIPERLQFVAVGDPATLRPQLAGLGVGDVHEYSPADVEAAE
jgi:zinc protease